MTFSPPSPLLWGHAPPRLPALWGHRLQACGLLGCRHLLMSILLPTNCLYVTDRSTAPGLQTSWYQDIGWARVARSWVRFIPAFTLTLRWVLEQEMTSPPRLQVHGQEHINPPDVSRFPLDGHLELWRLELEAKTLQDDDGHTWSSMWEEDRKQVGFVSKWNICQDQDEEVIVHFVGQHRPIGGVNSYAFTADIVIKASRAGIVWGCVAQASWASLQTPSTLAKTCKGFQL